jgi:hypothetical protein
MRRRLNRLPASRIRSHVRLTAFGCVAALPLVGAPASCRASGSKPAARTATPHLDVVLTDTGLTFSSREVPAGDRRPHHLAWSKTIAYARFASTKES